MLDFLKQVQVTAPEIAVRRSSGPRKERNPQNADLRVFVDGSVYPSAKLVERFSLEYGNKPEEKADPAGNGFDIIDSDEFIQWLKTPVRCIWISPVPRAESKIDLFGTVSYNEDGTPKVSVLEQGTKTFGENTLIPLLAAAYGITVVEEGEGDNKTRSFSNGKRYVDLQLIGPNEDGSGFKLPAGKTVAFVPKAKQRGEEKGMATVIRRENPEFWCLYPAQSETASADVEEAVEEVGHTTAEQTA